MKRFLRKILRRPRLRHNIQLEPLVNLVRCEYVGQIRIGYRTYSNDTLFRNVEIGRFCSIGRRCSIGAAKHHIDGLTSHPVGERDGFINGPPTKIGNDVWIGDNVVIVAGLTVGDGAVIGAGSIVTRDVPPFAIVAGVPARTLRLRFDVGTIERLVKLRWWIHGDLPLTREQSIAETLDEVEAGAFPIFEPVFQPYREY